MNPYDDLEWSLRGCRPRRPSLDLKRALFGPSDAVPPQTAPPLGQLWFAPLTATALLLLTVATAWSPLSGTGRDHYSLAALPAWETGVAIEQNAPPAPRFRSTNAGTVAPRFGSLLLRQTNVFAR
jgi:hypothetical protein